jgi:heme/copper-type cytochrome/quinol oxidase subunit 1
MLIFASGFALAGAYGMGRKVYGAEQVSRGFAETVGLGMMGVGGFVSILGGLLFLALVLVAWWRGAETGEHTQSEPEKGSMEVAL